MATINATKVDIIITNIIIINTINHHLLLALQHLL
jgi:hypothetical protein